MNMHALLRVVLPYLAERLWQDGVMEGHNASIDGRCMEWMYAVLPMNQVRIPRDTTSKTCAISSLSITTLIEKEVRNRDFFIPVSLIIEPHLVTCWSIGPFPS